MNLFLKQSFSSTVRAGQATLRRIASQSQTERPESWNTISCIVLDILYICIISITNDAEKLLVAKIGSAVFTLAQGLIKSRVAARCPHRAAPYRL